MKIILFPLSVVWLLLALAIANAIYNTMAATYIEFDFSMAMLGGSVFVVSAMVIPMDSYRFVNYLIHEISHAVFAVLCLSSPQKLSVDASGSGGIGGSFKFDSFLNDPLSKFVRAHLVYLAPYFFPIIPCVIAAKIFCYEMMTAIDCLVLGVAYGHHIVTVSATARPYQSDFENVGYCYGLSFVIFGNAAFLLLIFAAVTYQDTQYVIWPEFIAAINGVAAMME